jgi:hypothetical protein
MPRKNGRKGGKKSKGNRTVTVVAPSEAIERSLAVHMDSTVLKGKFLVTSSLVSTVVQAIAIFNPASLGVRAASMAVLFARYRFNWIAFKFFFTATSTVGVASVLGVLDDFTAEGDAPISIGGILELRCSATNYGGQTVPTEMLWKPPSNSWNFVSSGATGSDQRLVSPAVLYACSTGSGTLITEIMYSCVYKGAVDVGAN